MPHRPGLWRRVTVNQIAELSEEEEQRQRYAYLKTVKKQKGYCQLQTSHGKPSCAPEPRLRAAPPPGPAALADERLVWSAND